MQKRIFHFNPTVFENIYSLNSKVDKSLFKPILKNNEINFFSWLSEMKFGIYFSSINFNLEYDAAINKQTPDWRLKRNDEIIYVEVLRLNLHDTLMQEKIKELKERYFIRNKLLNNMFKSYSSGAMSMEESKLTDKELKYRSLINSCKNPFILCIDCCQQISLPAGEILNTFLYILFTPASFSETCAKGSSLNLPSTFK